MTARLSAFFNVHNIDKSLEFYRALGFKVDGKFEGEDGQLNYVELSLDGAELGLGRIGSSSDPEFQTWVSTPLGAGVLVNVEVPDVDRFHEKAVAAAVTIEMPITDRPYGRLFTVNDPDGYVVSFFTPPGGARGAKKATTATRRASARRSATRRTVKGKHGRRKAAGRRRRR